jgi:hypothetical protein
VQRPFLRRKQNSKGGGGVEQWLNMVSNIGFPILMSFYLLHRVEVKLDAIHEVLVSIKER